MGMQEKMMRKYIEGCDDTWVMIETSLSGMSGVGPKTHEKIINAIRLQARLEMNKVKQTLRPAELNKLNSLIDQIGFGERK